MAHYAPFAHRLTVCTGRTVVLGCVAFVLSAFGAHAQDAGPRVLFLTKSSGFEHSVIRADDDGSSHAGRHMRTIVEERLNGSIVETKDASQISQAGLAQYDVVVFYTTGRLDQPGSDGMPPMPEDGLDTLLGWIEDGGGFIGFHSASDTFKHTPDYTESPYIQMLGGQFMAHGRQFEASIHVVDPEHPTMAAFEEGFTHLEEWYRFSHMNRDTIRVLALLEVGEERRRQRMYDVPDYPLIWCRSYGEGRVYYNALGHREDVWDNDMFQASVADALLWAAGEGDANTEPNWDEVVPSEKPEEYRD